MTTHQIGITPLNEVFRKSSFTKPGLHFCVEVAQIDGTLVLRDSKNPGGPTLRFSKGEWNAFTKGVQAGEFNV